MNKSIIRQVIDLQNKSSVELREMYESLFGEPPRGGIGRDHLRPKIAYRIQELSLGGLKKETKEKLEKASNGMSPAMFKTDLMPGTRLCREYRGVMHEVEVRKDGFEYQGQKFRSLSAVARKITGTNWNGHKFFKLKK